MRRLLLINALIFAVLAAAVALAYYGYSYATDEEGSARRAFRWTAASGMGLGHGMNRLREGLNLR